MRGRSDPQRSPPPTWGGTGWGVDDGWGVDKMPDRFTIGIEEEFQLVDPETRELKSHIEEMMAAGAHLGDQIKPELHRSVVEVGTPVCANVREARQAVVHLRRSLAEMAEQGG